MWIKLYHDKRNVMNLLIVSSNWGLCFILNGVICTRKWITCEVSTCTMEQSFINSQECKGQNSNSYVTNAL